MDPTWQNASQPAAAGIMEACAAMFREAISYTELEFQTASAAGLPSSPTPPVRAQSAHARSRAIRQCWLYDSFGCLTGDHPAPCAVIRSCPSRQARYVVDLD
jgi:hypothetical protein